MNHREAYIFKGERFEIHAWESVIVGDILQVNMDEEFPADMVILCSSDSQGVVFKLQLKNNNISVLSLIYYMYTLDIYVQFIMTNVRYICYVVHQ